MQWKLNYIIKMNIRNLKILLVLVTLALPIVGLGQNETECRRIVGKLLTSIDNIKTLRYNLQQYERHGDEMGSAYQSVKVNMSPFKLYILNHSPDKGAEVLYVTGTNNGNCLVNPNAFPFFNVNLDPMGSMLRRTQHHTIFESGFSYFAKIIRQALVEFEKDFDKYCHYKGTVKWEGRECYKIVIDYTDFEYKSYSVKKGEDVIDIAKRMMVSEFMIVEANKDVDDYDDVKENQVIQVPNVYAKKSIIYVDKQYYLPIRQEMHDEKGLFETYEFHNLRVNQRILEEEFTETYPDYDF